MTPQETLFELYDRLEAKLKTLNPEDYATKTGIVMAQNIIMEMINEGKKLTTKTS
jgi:hypothetical protein